MSANTVGQTTTTDTSERKAREVAEAARETEWSRPSFAKGLYLGAFDLSLIHPHPQSSPDEAARGDKFLSQLTAYCETLDGRRIEREDRVPDDYIRGLTDLGVFGVKPSKTARCRKSRRINRESFFECG